MSGKWFTGAAHIVAFALFAVSVAWLAVPCNAQSWPPSFGAHFNSSTNTFYPWWVSPFNTGAGVTIQWYATISGADGYTGGANAPTSSPLDDATETVGWSFASDPPNDGVVAQMGWVVQKNEALAGTPVLSGSTIGSLDNTSPPFPEQYRPTTVDSTGLERHLTHIYDDIGYVGGSGGPGFSGPSSTAPTVDFVYKVTGPANTGITVAIGRAYRIYADAIFGTGSMSFAVTNPLTSYGSTFLTEGSYGSTTAFTRGTDTTVSFTIPASGVHYFVVPAYVTSSITVDASTTTDSAGFLEGHLNTRYEIVPYTVSSP